MKITFKLSDVEVPVDEKIVKLGGAEIEMGTDEHDTARITAMMNGYPKFVTEMVDTIKTQVLPMGEAIGGFIFDIENAVRNKKAALSQEAAHVHVDHSSEQTGAEAGSEATA